MAESNSTAAVAGAAMAPPATKRQTPYDRWVASTGVKVHEGYYVEDVRTLELGPWPERECNAAILKLAGQEGVSEARVTEIAPGKTMPPMRFAFDEIVYVASGRGLTTVWGEGQPKRTFEWGQRSMFLLPRNFYHQHSNTQGNSVVRLLHYNYLPSAMSTIPDPDFYFKNPFVDLDLLYSEGEFYSSAKSSPTRDRFGAPANIWYGNFFPDLLAWDKLDPYQGRGAGGHRLGFNFPNSTHTGHMSVFPLGTYKKGHRHGPGVVIIIPGGEGFSFMWPEGEEKVYIPWHEASVFVPPNRWFHQHFNTGTSPARYLAFHGPPTGRQEERIEDVQRDQIEYSDEDPLVRQTFKDEVEKRGLKSLMPDEAYKDRNYAWAYEGAAD